MAREFRVGVVGLHRGHGLVRALANHPQVTIAALCDLDLETVRQVGADHGLSEELQFTDFDAFLQAPIDVVAIATPIGFHADQAVAALSAGKHVLSEQTMAYTVEDCRRIVEATGQSGRHYMMAENFTYFPYFREWQKLIQSGGLGEIVYAEAEYLHEIIDRLENLETGDYRWRSTRPPIWYCGHSLGPLLTLLDDRIVMATGAATGSLGHPDKPIGYLDMEVGLFKTEKGRFIKILRSQTVRRYPSLVWYSIYGTKGFVENGREGGWGTTEGYYFLLDSMDTTSGAQRMVSPTVDPQLPADAALKGSHGTSEYVMVREFFKAIEANVSPPIDAVRAAEITVPGLIAHEAAMQGGVWLDVPQFR